MNFKFSFAIAAAFMLLASTANAQSGARAAAPAIGSGARAIAPVISAPSQPSPIIQSAPSIGSGLRLFAQTVSYAKSRDDLTYAVC